MKFHKNFRLVALFVAMMALGAQATPVSSVEVCRAVSAWAAANGSAFANLGTVDTAEPVSENGTNLYWIVKMSNGGVVIASPDTDIDLVVAVLEKSDGKFQPGHPLPSVLRADMLNRISVIGGGSNASTLSASASSASAAVLPEDVRASIQKANSQWAKYGGAAGGVGLLAASSAADEPTLFIRRVVDGFEEGGRYTHWNQGRISHGQENRLCYNYYTPGNSVCGCVATAAAAVMQFFGVTNDIGSVGTVTEAGGCTYEGNPYSCKTLPGAIDWSIVPDTDVAEEICAAAVKTNAICELFGRVTYNLGVLVGMGWTAGSSGAITAYLPDVFKAYGFNTSRWVSYEGDDAGQYMKTIYAQNWCGAPVVLSINGAPGGHAVVACGSACDELGEDYCRVFMGWGGSDDAWYKFPEVQAFNVVNGAVTMIGYEDDAVVPVYGSANMPGIMLTLPGYEDSDGAEVEPRAVEVNGEGFFGVRIPLSIPTEACVITYTNRTPNISFPITPLDPDVLTNKEVVASAEIDEALPNEVFFSLLNMTLCPSVESGRAVALRDGKALLMVSGNASGERTKKLLNALYHLDETSSISNEFVFVFTSINSTALNGVDGDPAIGVFDPAIGSADDRWWEMNGRLVYTNFIDSVDDETGEIIYTIDGMTEADVENALVDMLEEGYDQHQRNHSGIEITVAGVNVHSGEAEPFDIGAPSPVYGVHSSSWTNCESVVFSAPGVYTNIEEGVVYSCVGWSTNDVFDADGNAVYAEGTEVTLEVVSNSVFTFTWVWDATHYRVTAGSDSGVGIVTPGDIWYAAGERVTITAEPDGNATLDGGYGWDIWTAGDADYQSQYDGTLMPDAYVGRNGNTISFFVYEPVEVVAYYTTGTPSYLPVKEYTVEFTASPEWITNVVALKSGYVWGTNVTIDPILHIEPSVLSYVDSDTNVWVCTGWEIDGEKYESYALVGSQTEGAVMSAKCLWEIKAPDPEPEDPAPEDPEGGDDDGDGDDEDDVTPGPIAFSTVEKVSDTEWNLTITNAVKGCWYYLYSAVGLSPVPVQWDLATVNGENPVQADSDGPMTFSVPADGTARFWKAKATATKETP